MTDPFFGPLVEALETLRVNHNKMMLWPFNLEHASDGQYDTFLEQQMDAERSEYEARKALTSHDPAPVLRVLRAAVELEKERKNIVSGAATPSTTNFVQAESNHIIAVNALLEVPAYREWLEGVE